MSEIEKWYDEEYEEWERLDRHRVEFDITKRIMDRFIPDKPMEIIDIGGGPGRYSIYLAQKGHRVTLLDLSSKHIRIAKEKSKAYGVTLVDAIHGNALDLSQLAQQYDVVLLMGPLYHLIQEEDRRKAVEEALKHLKPGGLLFASFISNYAAILDSLGWLYPVDDPNRLLKYLEDGVNCQDEGFTTAYFSSHQEAMELMRSFGLEQLAFAGVENILGTKEREVMSLEEGDYQKWLEIAYALAEDPHLYGMSQHYLYVGKKPLSGS